MNKQELEIKMLDLENDYKMGARYYWMSILELLEIYKMILEQEKING